MASARVYSGYIGCQGKMASTMDFAEEFPSIAWWSERVIGSAAILVVVWTMSFCWSKARTNQRLSLSDWDERGREERRGLLVGSRRMA